MREHHVWSSFGPNSWERVRVIKEEYDEQGRLISTGITDTTTTLLEATAEQVLLRIEETNEIAGKRFDRQPQTIAMGYAGQTPGQQVSARRVGEGSVTISGERIPTQVRQVTVVGDTYRRVSNIHYSDHVFPFVLRRETQITDLTGEVPLGQTTVTVLAVDVPFKVLAEIKTAAYVKTIHTTPRGRTVTIEVWCLDVPGFVVAHSSKELDSAGRLTSRSTLELLDYGLGEEDDGRLRLRHRLFRRRVEEPPSTAPRTGAIDAPPRPVSVRPLPAGGSR